MHHHRSCANRFELTGLTVHSRESDIDVGLTKGGAAKPTVHGAVPHAGLQTLRLNPLQKSAISAPMTPSIWCLQAALGDLNACKQREQSSIGLWRPLYGKDRIHGQGSRHPKRIRQAGLNLPSSSNSKCNTASPDELRCCHANICYLHLSDAERDTLSFGLAQSHSLRMMVAVLECPPAP